jgi:hypothetical protein
VSSRRRRGFDHARPLPWCTSPCSPRRPGPRSQRTRRRPRVIEADCRGGDWCSPRVTSRGNSRNNDKDQIGIFRFFVSILTKEPHAPPPPLSLALMRALPRSPSLARARSLSAPLPPRLLSPSLLPSPPPLSLLPLSLPPSLSRQYASRMQDWLRIAGTLWGGCGVGLPSHRDSHPHSSMRVTDQ